MSLYSVNWIIIKCLNFRKFVILGLETPIVNCYSPEEWASLQ